VPTKKCLHEHVTSNHLSYIPIILMYLSKHTEINSLLYLVLLKEKEQKEEERRKKNKGIFDAEFTKTTKKVQNMVLYIQVWTTLICKFKACLAQEYLTRWSLNNLFVRCASLYLQVKVVLILITSERFIFFLSISHLILKFCFQ